MKAMSRLSLSCLVLGHDDWIKRTPGRMYLECLECGRETSGWDLADRPARSRATPSESAMRVLRHDAHAAPRCG